MHIKFNLSDLLPTRLQLQAQSAKKTVSSRQDAQRKFWRVRLLAPGISLAFLFFPHLAQAQSTVVGVVKSTENATEWTGITRRLQVANVDYCVIELPTVKSAADLGERAVVFLPNVETLTPAQVLALENWMSRGGRVIVSGPVGNTSQPGVRQLLRSLLGAYWGFNLSAPSKLQPLRTKTQEWVRRAGDGGVVRGGVLIPASLNSKPAAVWQSKENPPAVVTTERSTFLGWLWGTSASAPVELDSAWLRAALSRSIQLNSTETTNVNVAAKSPKNCNGKVATAFSPQPTATPRPNTAETKKPAVTTPSVRPLRTAIAPTPVARPRTITQQLDEPIEKLAPAGLGVSPNSKAPISNLQAIALHQELENLIGRFESAQLSANAITRNSEPSTMAREAKEVASTSTPRGGTSETVAKAVAEARQIAKALPQLIRQKNYAAARQQWLKAQQLLWNNYPTDRTLAQPEIRAMWLDRGSIVRAGSERGLAKIFDQLAASGINTIFFETVNAGYPIYPSQVAPEQNPLIRGWDPLAAAVKLAHERNMELHAWVWAFAAGNQRHNTLINLPINHPGPLITAHPTWASYDNRGNLFPPGQGKPFLDPANLEVRRYLLRLYDEIVSRYQVDGLHLDYIRYPFQDPSAERTYGYGIAARQQFQALAGVDPTKISPRQSNLWQRWTQFRSDKIDSFVAQTAQQMRRTRPNLILSVAVFPLSEHERIQKLQQHWEVWASRGDVDLVVPMTYALDTYRFQRLAQPWITSTKLGSTLILPGIRLLNLPLSVAVDQIQLSRDLPVSGYSLFAAENLTNELQKIFYNTQGIGRSTPQEPVPYRQPFQAAVARYAALQREWSFLSTNQQLWLRGRSLTSFNERAKDLESALRKLSESPSASRLATARGSLNSFQLQFRDWMRLQALENPYQVKVWSNRLSTVERLLLYGERVVLKRESPPVAEQP